MSTVVGGTFRKALEQLNPRRSMEALGMEAIDVEKMTHLMWKPTVDGSEIPC